MSSRDAWIAVDVAFKLVVLLLISAVELLAVVLMVDFLGAGNLSNETAGTTFLLERLSFKPRAVHASTLLQSSVSHDTNPLYTVDIVSRSPRSVVV